MNKFVEISFRKLVWKLVERWSFSWCSSLNMILVESLINNSSKQNKWNWLCEMSKYRFVEICWFVFIVHSVEAIFRILPDQKYFHRRVKFVENNWNKHGDRSLLFLISKLLFKTRDNWVFGKIWSLRNGFQVRFWIRVNNHWLLIFLFAECLNEKRLWYFCSNDIVQWHFEILYWRL